MSQAPKSQIPNSDHCIWRAWINHLCQGLTLSTASLVTIILHIFGSLFFLSKSFENFSCEEKSSHNCIFLDFFTFTLYNNVYSLCQEKKNCVFSLNLVETISRFSIVTQFSFAESFNKVKIKHKSPTWLDKTQHYLKQSTSQS